MFEESFDKAANQRKTLAIEFRQDSVRILQFQRAGGAKYTLRSFVEAPIPKGAYENGIIKLPAEVGKIITDVLGQAKPKSPDTSYAICLVPQENIFLMSFDVPNVSDDEVGNVVANKVADLIPMPEKDVYWTWQAIGKEKNKVQVQLAAVSKRIIDSYMQTLEQARLIPLLFEPSAEAASRVGQVKGETYLFLVELTNQMAIISIARGEAILFSTDVPLELSTDGRVHPRRILDKINELIRFAQQTTDEKVLLKSHIRLYGAPKLVDQTLASIKELGSNYNISRIKYQHTENNPISQYLPGDKLDEYVPLIGSAIRGLPGYSENAVSLNLVPAKAKEAFVREEVASITRKYLAFIAVDVLFILLALFLVNFRVEGNRGDLERRLESIRSVEESQRVVELEKSINNLNKDTSVVINAAAQIKDWEKVLKTFSSSVPDEITIGSLSITPPEQKSGPNRDNLNVKISGVFKDREDLINFMDELRDTKVYTQVKLPVSSLESSENGTFEIEAKLPIKFLTGATI